MKLTKKQLSASYVTQATVSVVRHIDDVANRENYRLDSCLTASPQGKVESIPHVSFAPPLGKGYGVHTRRLFKFIRPRASRSTASLKSGTRVVR